MTSQARRRRIVHVVYSFDVGGLENVIVQLINRLPADQFEHILLSLTTIGDFKGRITREDVRFVELKKSPGHAVPMYPRIWALFRKWRPDVVHTCNLAALEVVPLAWLAGVPLRIHAEHGWDAHDPKGQNKRYQRLRRLYKPFVSHYVAVSQDLYEYLGRAVGVDENRRSLIPNGVDTDQFCPADGPPEAAVGCPFDPTRHLIIGTVGRLQTVKNQPLLARAFVRLLKQHPELARSARLLMVGEGPLRGEVEAILREAAMNHLAWFPGARNDVPAILRMMSIFVLPSITEGTSCTLQEAMATGLPVVVTQVGGNAMLVADEAGILVPSENEDALAGALFGLLKDSDRRKLLSERARQRATHRFGFDQAERAYGRLFGQEQEGVTQ